MNIATNASGLIVMVSDSGSPTPPDGGSLYTLTNAQRLILVALAQQPNGGITFDGVTFTALPFVPPPVIDPADSDNLEKTLKAICLMTGRWANKTPTQIRTDFRSAWQALP